jgi:putative colanic acid biosynthesis acetyltransferase WcaF
MSADRQSDETPAWVDLGAFDNRPDYHPGRGWLARGVWYFVGLLLFESGWVPLSGVKRWLLRRFGARVGQGVVIKPNVRIKYPWRLTIGDHCWIGQDVWIDNVADVDVGDHVCISQQAYLCTGSHDYQRRSFDLVTGTIRIGNGAWIGARALLLGGVTVHANAVIAAASIVTRDVAAAAIVAGNPARPLKRQRKPPQREEPSH